MNGWRYAEAWPDSTTQVIGHDKTMLEITNHTDVSVQVRYRPEIPWQERWIGLDLWLLSAEPVPSWRRAVSRVIGPIIRSGVKKSGNVG